MDKKILIGLGIIFILALIFIFYFVKIVTISLLISILIYYILLPTKNFFSRQGISDTLSAVLTISLFFLSLSILFIVIYIIIYPYFDDFLKNSQERISEINKTIANLFSFIPKLIDIEGIISKYSFEFLTKATQGLLNTLPKFLKETLIVLLMIPFITFYLLKEFEDVKRRIVSRISNKYFEMALYILWRTDKTMSDYIKAIFLKSVILSAITSLLMLIFGIPGWIVWGVIFGFSPIIPYIGSIATTLFAFLGILLIFGDVNSAILSIFISLGIHLLDNVLLTPIMFSHSVDLHPITVLLLIIVGMEIFGILGAIFIIPFASIIKIGIEEFLKLYRFYT